MRKMNMLAYEELVLSIDGNKKRGRIAFKIVKACKTKDNPSGNARLAWKRLVLKYENKSTPNVLKMEKLLSIFTILTFICPSWAEMNWVKYHKAVETSLADPNLFDTNLTQH